MLYFTAVDVILLQLPSSSTLAVSQESRHDGAPYQRSTFSPEKRATRPSFLPYRSLLRKHTNHSSVDKIETRPPDKSTGAIPKQYWHCKASRPTTNCSMAPKATPEDSLIDSYSASSEEDRGILCPPPKTVHTEIAMQAKMLSALEDKRTDPVSVLKQGDKSDQLVRRTDRGSSRSQPNVYGETIPTHDDTALSSDSRHVLPKHDDNKLPSNNRHVPPTQDDTKLPSDNRRVLPMHDNTQLPRDSRHLLVKQLSETESDRGWRGSREAIVGRSLPSSTTRLVHFDISCDDVRPKAPCLPPATVRFLIPADDSESDGSSTTLVAPPSTEMKRRALSLSLGEGVEGKLALPPKCMLKHGLSPSSPSYQEKHVKFCHVGAHALDMFFSPDDHSPSSFFRSVPCFSKEQGARDRSYMLPHVGAMTPHEAPPAPSLLAPFEALPSVEDDYDYDDDDYCLISSKYELPDHLRAAPTLVVNSPKRTFTDGTTVRCASPTCKLALTGGEDGNSTNPVLLSTRWVQSQFQSFH